MPFYTHLASICTCVMPLRHYQCYISYSYLLTKKKKKNSTEEYKTGIRKFSGMHNYSDIFVECG